MLPAKIPVYRGNALHQALDDYQAAKVAKKAAEDKEAAARDAILATLRDRPVILVGDRVVRVREVAAVPAVTITTAMVGRTLAGRKGHRVVEVFPARDEA